MPSLKTEISDMNFDEESGILHIQMFPGVEITLQNTKDHYQFIAQLTQGRKYIVLIDATHYFIIDPEALKYSAEKNPLVNRVAVAHYNSTVANMLTIDFFKKNLKPGIPVGAFKTKEEALKWIEQLENEGIFNKRGLSL